MIWGLLFFYPVIGILFGKYLFSVKNKFPKALPIRHMKKDENIVFVFMGLWPLVLAAYILFAASDWVKK